MSHITSPTSRDAGIFVLADDLTGAADAAGYFRRPGRRVRVTFAETQPWDFSRGHDTVQVYDTESRAASRDEARRRVAAAVEPLSARAVPVRAFKKIDSTLRGPIGAELEAALGAFGWRLAVVAPAFPANRRIVRGGRVFVAGVPLTQTSAARDPRTPVRSDRVGDVLRETSKLPAHEIDLATIREGPGRLAGVFRAVAEYPAIAVCDAETPDDLDIIAAALGDAGDMLPCGSAGLARAVAATWGACPPSPGPAGAGSVPPRCGAVLVAVGSANPEAHEQLEILSRAVGVPPVTMDVARLATPVARADEIGRARARVVESGDPVQVVGLSSQRIGGDAGGGSAPGFEEDLAQVGAAWIETRGQVGPLGVVCTGGDTALAFCRALRVRAIWPEGAVSPGIPWSVVEHPGPPTFLVSKAGGFGGRSALIDAVRFLRTGGGKSATRVRA